jgi:hypothetical protein
MARPLPLALLLCVLLATPAAATSVRSLGVRELAAGAELVFEGRVLGSEVREGRRGSLRTCLRFEVIEVLKGSAASNPLELCFAGGALGTRRVRVEGMRLPRAGERGVYFVAPSHAARVHPLLGWDQGRFRIREGAEPIVTSASGQPVLALEPASEGLATGPSGRVARGARLGASGGGGLSPGAFKARLREILAEESR